MWWLISYVDPQTGDTVKHEWQAAINDRNNGSGCPAFSRNRSRGEKKILKYLQSHGIKNEQEKIVKFGKTFIGRYDFKTEAGFIEFDGEQHFQSVDYFGGLQKYDKRIASDDRKTEYCHSHEIPLLRIRYDQFKKLEEILDFFFENPEYFVSNLNPFMSDEEYYRTREKFEKIVDKAA